MNNTYSLPHRAHGRVYHVRRDGRSQARIASRGTIVTPRDAAIATIAPAHIIPARATMAHHQRCAMLVDRHAHKTGGTTLRRIFLANECRDEWMYVGYGLERPDYKPLLEELTSRNLSMGVGAPARFLVEVHYPANAFHPHRLWALAQQRDRLRGQCAITLMTRTREPLSFYWSFFVWSHRAASLPSGAHALRRAFWDWAPPNLQANALWDAMVALPAEQSAVRREERPAVRANLAVFDERAFSGLIAVLGLYDIVGVVEQWDAALLLAARRVGLRHLTYPRSVTPSCPSSGDAANTSMGAAREHSQPCLPSLDVLCPRDMRSQCGAKLRRLAPLDYRLHAFANESFTRLRAAAGPEFERELTEHRQRLRRFQMVYQAQQRERAAVSSQGRVVLRSTPCTAAQQRTERCRKRAARMTDARCDFANLVHVTSEGAIRRPMGLPQDVARGSCCSASPHFCRIMYHRRGHTRYAIASSRAASRGGCNTAADRVEV